MENKSLPWKLVPVHLQKTPRLDETVLQQNNLQTLEEISRKVSSAKNYSVLKSLKQKRCKNGDS